MKPKSNNMMVLLVIWAILLGLSYLILPKYMGDKGAKKDIQPADVMYQQAEKLDEAAGTDKKAFGKVNAKYQVIVKAHPGTEYAAKALLRKGIIFETKMNDTLHAVETYTNLRRDYTEKYPEIAAAAQKQLNGIDKKNSVKPMYKIFDFLVSMTGHNAKYSYFLALLIITLVFKLVTSPLSHLQFKYMKELQKIQPLVKAMQEQYKGDSKLLGEKLMALYKEHNVNPFSSCLPMLVQMPVMILLYNMVRLYQVQFANGEFLWVGSSLAHSYPTIVAANLALPDVPMLVIYSISMFISQKLTIVDPAQAEQQKMMTYFMPIMFAVLFKGFPAAFMLYWLLFNILSTAQQYYILKPKKPESTDGSGGGTIIVEAVPETPKSLPTNPGKARRRKKKFDIPQLGTSTE